MSYILRTLTLRDVARALKRRELRLAFRISQNLCSNAVSSVRCYLCRPSRPTARRPVRRAS